MKPVKESLYDFERGLDPKAALGIGMVAKIQKWFTDLRIYDKKYEITPNGAVIFKGCLDLQYINIAWLPDNFYISGFLDIRGTQIKELPNGLRVKSNLRLENTGITQLPDDLYVKDYIYVNVYQTELIKSIGKSRFKNKLQWVA